MTGLSLSEIYMILNSYAKENPGSEALENLYELLVSHPIYKEKKEKERTKEKETKDQKIEEKIMSLIEGHNDNAMATVIDVEKFIAAVSDQVFTTVDIYSALCAATKQHKDNIRYALGKAVKEGRIISEGKRSGAYRRVIKDYEEQAWWESDGKPLHMRFPLDMHNLVKILPGSVILAEGEKSSGKTAYALETCRLNQHLFPDERIVYLNVEMANAEIYERAKNYQASDTWSIDGIRNAIEFIRQSDNWADRIKADCFNVVDYVRDTLEPYKIASHIEAIHNKIGNGIALICVQRIPGRDFGVGGAGIRAIPRLVVSLTREGEHRLIKIEDAKHFWNPPNPSGMQLAYTLVAGHKWQMASEAWEHQERAEKKRKYGDYIS